MIDTALITAGGKGTRLRPITSIIPKVMLPLGTIPTLQFVICEALDAEILNIIIIIGQDGKLIKRYFDETNGTWKGRITYILQKEPKGLGDAIRCGRDSLDNKPFLVMFGDSIFLEGNPTRVLQQDFQSHSETILGVQRVVQEQTPKRGMVESRRMNNGRYRVSKIIEKPAIGTTLSNLAMVGRSIFYPTLFDAITRVKPDKNGEIQLTPAINILTESESIAAIEIPEQRLDIGNPEDYNQAYLSYLRWKSS